jgi:hypothetical protein
MLFKSTGVASEFPLAHPEIKKLAHELDEAMQEWGLGHVVITDVMRTPAFYGNEVPPFSWHYVGCAIDIRSNQLRPAKKLLVFDWLSKRCPKGLGWDVVFEPNAPRGEHFHVEYEVKRLKDEWRQKHAAQGAV